MNASLKIKEKSTHPNYLAILRVSEDLGLPRHFRTDLTVHDRKFVCEHSPKASFIWAVDEDGTHTFRLGGVDPQWKINGRPAKARDFVRLVREVSPLARFFVVRRGVAREIGAKS
jgi:hypothetical protein